MRPVEQTIKRRAEQFVADNPQYFLGLSKADARCLAEALMFIGASIVHQIKAEETLAELTQKLAEYS